MTHSKQPLHPVFAEFRRKRKALGLKQWEVAKRTGVTEQTISFWENGFSTPSWFMTACWAEALGFELALKETRDGREQLDA